MSDYNVVLLVEQSLTATDAKQIRGLHEDIEDPVRYFVLEPFEDAAVRIESAMGALGTSGELLPTGLAQQETDVEAMQSDLREEAEKSLASSLAALEAAGGTATGELLAADPVDGLVAKVRQVSAAETIILTSPHVVSEFFHLDWTSRARRKLGVPVLHLLEHETFDEQAGQGEGVTGL
jgi:hypothetical protein